MSGTSQPESSSAQPAVGLPRGHLISFDHLSNVPLHSVDSRLLLPSQVQHHTLLLPLIPLWIHRRKCSQVPLRCHRRRLCVSYRELTHQYALLLLSDWLNFHYFLFFLNFVVLSCNQWHNSGFFLPCVISYDLSVIPPLCEPNLPSKLTRLIFVSWRRSEKRVHPAWADFDSVVTFCQTNRG